MFDEIAKKLNTLDTNYPVKNYYENTDYKVNDIIKNNGYLYRVFKDFTSDNTDYYLKSNCNLLTPFKKLELDTDYKANELIEYENNFLIVQKDFRYEDKNGVLTDLNGLLKPLQDIIIWFDGISKIYKNQIIIKDNFSYIVLEDIENPVWGNIQKKIDYFNKAENSFYDDSSSGFGNNTNTVQKAIEKLKSNKQDSLIPGNNINLNGSNISVIGGTSKEYILENNYFINDLIVKDEKIYRVNEDFISTDWSTDRAKLTLISSGGSGGSNEAIDINFDNSKTKLEYLSGYDFPKFKVAIPNTINLTFKSKDVDGVISNAEIKKENDEYRLKGTIVCTQSFSNTLTCYFYLNDDSNYYKLYSIMSQFFEFTNDTAIVLGFIPADDGEIFIEGLESEYQFKFIYSNSAPPSNGRLYIQKKDGSDFDTEPSNIILNIKNRVLKPEDRNIFAVNSNFQQNLIASLCNLELNETSSSVKLQGTFTSSIFNVGTIDGLFFYSPIIENYFNLSDGINLTNTTGITSSRGKAVKFGITKISDTPADNISKYVLSVAYQDGSSINQGDVFTFNLTPDKNSTLNPIYQDAANVQQAIEVVVNQKLPDVYDYSGVETQTNKIAKFADGTEKPIYRIIKQANYEFIKDGKYKQFTILTRKNIIITNAFGYPIFDNEYGAVINNFPYYSISENVEFRFIWNDINIIAIGYKIPATILRNYNRYLAIIEYTYDK